MGEVFLAEDTRLGRRVALKQLTGAWLAAGEARRHLLHEARAAAALNHANIAAVYDVIEEADRACIVFEYVEGESLAERLGRGPVPPAEVVEIALQLTEALAEAHGCGVIHRDLKPANVRLTPAGRVKVLDFGIAKLLPTAPSDDATVTAMGPARTVGTVAYMAPEQLLGGHVDERSDVYGLGLLLYELLVGQLPFAARDPMGRTMAALTERPRPPADIDPSIPGELSACVMRALEREPAGRFQTARDLLHALRAARADTPRPAPRSRPGWRLRPSFRAAVVLPAVAVALAIAATAAYWRPPGPGKAAFAVARQTVAVPALANLSGDPANEYLGVGIAETISTTLAQLSGLAVVARADVSDAARDERDAAKLAARVGASFVVDGGVQQAGDRLLVTLRLVRSDRSVVWAESVEGTLAQLFDLQDRLARAIVSALSLQLSEADRARLSARRSPRSESLPDYWRARALLENRQDPGNAERAAAMLETVVRENPTVAVAHAALGEAYWQRYEATKDGRWAQRALAASQDALRLDPNLPAVRYSLAIIYSGTGRQAEAFGELRRVLDAQPDNVEALVLDGRLLAEAGKVDQALVQFDRAVLARPGYWGTYSELGRVLWSAGRYQQAASAFLKVTELLPDSSWGFQQLGTVFHTIGDRARARENYERSIALGPSPPAYSNLGSLFYEEGKYEEAAKAFERALQLAPGSDIRHRNLGDAYTRLGRAGDATRAYERAVELAAQGLAVNPADGELLGRLALYQAKLGRFRVAARTAAKAVEIAPTSGRVQYYAAVAWALSGDRSRALDAVRAAVAGGFSATRIRVDDDLAALHKEPGFEGALRSGT